MLGAGRKAIGVQAGRQSARQIYTTEQTMKRFMRIPPRCDERLQECSTIVEEVWIHTLPFKYWNSIG